MSVEWKVDIDPRAGLQEDAARVYEINDMGGINLIAKCPDERRAERIVAAFRAAAEAGVQV